MLNLLFLRRVPATEVPQLTCVEFWWGREGTDPSRRHRYSDFDEVNLPVISKTRKCAEGAEFWLKFPWKSWSLLFWCWWVNVVDRLPSAYQMWLPLFYVFFFLFSFPLCLQRLPALVHVLLHLPPVHWSAFQGISLFNICYKFQLAQVTISAALRCLLIFMSTCRNICFGVSFVNASSYLVWLATSCPLSLTLTKRFSLLNAW